MSFQFPHSARLTPPICANAWKTLECDSLLGIWLAAVFCSECVPDVFFFFFAILCQFVPRRGVDCVFYYDALKGCGALVLVVDWKWKPPPHYRLDSPSIHPSIHPRPGCVGVGEGRERGLANGRTAVLSDWPKSERYSHAIITGDSGSSWPDAPSLCCLRRAMLGRSECLFPSAITGHVNWMKSTLLPVCSSSGLPACLLEWLHVDHWKHHSVFLISSRLFLLPTVE